MVDRKTEISDHFIHAGAGSALAVANLGALIPGLIPALALTAVIAVVLVAPFVVLGLAVGLIAAPFYLTSRLVRRPRRHRPTNQAPSEEPASGKLAVVTGASSGLGLETAKQLARQGFEIAMICRDPQRGERARSQVAEEATGKPPVLLLAELSVPPRIPPSRPGYGSSARSRPESTPDAPPSPR